MEEILTIHEAEVSETLAARLQDRHRQLGEQLNRTEARLRAVKAALAHLEAHPEDEAIWRLLAAE